MVSSAIWKKVSFEIMLIECNKLAAILDYNFLTSLPMVSPFNCQVNDKDIKNSEIDSFNHILDNLSGTVRLEVAR